VEGPSGWALVECGPPSTLDVLLRRVAELGASPRDIHHLMVTHVHLDHAGAAGWWATQGTQVHVHHLGAPHLVDPSRLLASAERIYGDRMESLWGRVLAAPADHVVPASDGDHVDAAGLRFEALDMPGHARHHLVWALGKVAFTGDAAGVRLPDVPLVDLPAPPPEFDREAWYASIARLSQRHFRSLYPTHFGRVADVAAHLRELETLIAEASGFVHGMLAAGADRDLMQSEYQAWSMDRLRAAGAGPDQLRRYELANPFEMSVDGLVRYWRKRAAA
jgi:glyoxylase-like metal-dependent hydrolase (beta-lactamase superfamily II)